MPLVNAAIEGWGLNRINCGPPFRVEPVGPYNLLQVTDARGVVALSGPGGAVFCACPDQAERLCEAANSGVLHDAYPGPSP